MELKELFANEEVRMDKAIESFKKELAAIRTGRASVSLLDRITVDYYGTPTPVNQVANVSAPEARLIEIKPWERTLLGDIERAILTSDLGLTPNNDGTLIRLIIPQLTEERRKELVKVVSKRAEEAKVAIRNIRRDANDSIKKMEKEKAIVEDESKKAQADMQKLTDKKVQTIDELKEKKEKEVMEV